MKCILQAPKGKSGSVVESVANCNLSGNEIRKSKKPTIKMFDDKNRN